MTAAQANLKRAYYQEAPDLLVSMLDGGGYALDELKPLKSAGRYPLENPTGP